MNPEAPSDPPLDLCGTRTYFASVLCEGHLVLCRISLFLLMPLLGPTAASVMDFLCLAVASGLGQG